MLFIITRHQREVNNRILREQESDYQRSLAADRARLNERRRAESERKMAEIKEAEEKKKKQEKKEVILFRSQYIINYKIFITMVISAKCLILSSPYGYRR